MKLEVAAHAAVYADGDGGVQPLVVRAMADDENLAVVPFQVEGKVFYLMVQLAVLQDGQHRGSAQA